MRRILPFLLPSFLAAAPPSGAQLERRFDRFSTDQGLSQSTVRTILRDHRGFMWFGTDDGLNKYDGYRFVTYRRDPEDPRSLSDNYVRVLHDDRERTLWVGTNFGLNAFDRSTGEFRRFLRDPDDPASLPNDSIHAIVEDAEGYVWVGTDGGLARLDPAREKFETFRHRADDPASLPHDSIRALHLDPDGSLWVGTLEGVAVRAPGARGFRAVVPADPLPDEQWIVRLFAPDLAGDVLWIGTSLGLFRYERATGAVRLDPRPEPPDGEPLSVRALAVGKSGSIWVGEEDSGIYEIMASGVDRFLFAPGEPRSLSSNLIRSLYEDPSGLLWVGTFGGGLNRLDLKDARFPHFHSQNRYPAKIHNDTVRAFYEDAQGRVWIGTDGGISRFDRKSRSYTYYRHGPEDKSSLANDSVYAIVGDREGAIWVGMFDGGVARYNPRSDDFTRFRHDPSNPESLSGDRVRVLLPDRAGRLWVGHHREGLSRLDPESGKFRRYRRDPADARSISDDLVYSLHEDRAGTIWIGTANGLNAYDEKCDCFQRHVFQMDGHGGMSDKSVLSILEDRSGALWLGTFVGLNLFDREGGTFVHFNEKDGLPNDVIYGIVEDETGSLWLSTNKGLSQFDPRKRTFRNYDVKDGLQDNEFLFGSCYRSAEGELFFGGRRGYNAFFPNRVARNPHVPEVVITDFRVISDTGVASDPRHPHELPKDAGPVRLSHRDRVLSFEFAALDFSAPEKNQYAYRLEGFRDEWEQVADRRYVTYTNLPAGHYVFRVKGSNDNGVWNEEGASVRLTVVPPFWATLWFKAATVALGLLLASGVYALRVRALHLRREELEKEVDERTRELREKKDELEGLVRRLQTVQSQLIESKKMAALGDLVASFVHELATPLGALRSASEVTQIGARRLARLFDDPGAAGPKPEALDRSLEVLEENARVTAVATERLARIASSLKSFIQLDAASFRVADIHEGLESAITLLEPELRGRVTMVREYSEVPRVGFYPAEMNQVFMNLLRNAAGAIQDQGTIWIRTRVREGMVEVEFRDDGRGIDPGDMSGIFQPRLKSDGGRVSASLGLFASQNILQKHRGSIAAESRPGEGSRFTVRFPTNLLESRETPVPEATVSSST